MSVFFFQAEDGIRDLVRSRGLGDVYKRQVPRLSVDIDLNYVGAIEREVMVAERPKVEQAVQALSLIHI